MTHPLFDVAAPTRRIQLSDRSWLEHTPAWLPDPDTALTELLTELHWTQEALTMWGRTVHQPRLTAVCGRSMDPASRYTRPRPEQPWTPRAAAIRDRVTAAVPGWTPTGLIANWYRTGSDSIGFHSDDEPVLGTDPLVVSVSLGATRTLQFRLKGGGPAIARVPLGHGDLLTMAGATQTEYEHGITKTRRVHDPRISITLRNYPPART
jgi:alkylated DNA repair dioxygenase AlkB